MFSFDSIHTLLSGTLHCSWVVKIKFQKWQKPFFNKQDTIALWKKERNLVISSTSSSTSYLPLLLNKRTKLCVEAENPSLPRTKRKRSTQFYTLVRDQNKIFGKSTKAKNPQKPPQKKRAITSKASGKSNKITEGRNKQKHFWRPIGVQGKLSENQRQHFFVKLIFECVLIL